MSIEPLLGHPLRASVTITSLLASSSSSSGRKQTNVASPDAIASLAARLTAEVTHPPPSQPSANSPSSKIIAFMPGLAAVDDKVRTTVAIA